MSAVRPQLLAQAAAESVASGLATFAVGWPSDAIPQDARDRAARHLLDTVGCGLAAVGSGAADAATEVAVAQGGKGEASVLGERTRLPGALAALANGTRCHALDFDDTHERGICHASTVVVPAALAVGEATGSSGRAVIDAYVVGSEVALRIAVGGVADSLYARGFHPTPICAAFGAAAAASRLLGLRADETVHALGIVGSFAAGLFEYLGDGSATKPLHAGWAAHAGVHAAQLASAGATGPASVIEGRFGLLASHIGSALAAPAMCVRLGETWEIANVSIKPFPACHFVHSSTWAAARLAEEHGLMPADIARIFVRISPEGIPLVLTPPSEKAEPRTAYDAKFSLPFAVAHHLVHGHLDISAFSPTSIRDPDVLALAERVRSEPLRRPFPASRFAGGARLVTHAGDELDAFIEHVPGSPQNPLDERWLLAKFRSNAATTHDSTGADALAEELLSLDEAPSLGPTMVRVRFRRPGQRD